MLDEARGTLTKKTIGFGVGGVCRLMFNDNSENRKAKKLRRNILIEKTLSDDSCGRPQVSVGSSGTVWV